MQPPESYDCIVIGAGIIGINAALALQTSGRKVTVLDSTGIGAGASQGNAGAFAFSDIVPLATPGIMRKAPRWLLDPLGPLSIPPAYALPILPWMMRFWRASWQDRYQAAIKAQISLMALAKTALEQQVKLANAEHLLQREGQLQLYESEKEWQATLPEWDIRQQYGIRFQHLNSSADIATIQAGISPRFTHATFTPDWINTCDPAKWLHHLANVFRQQGGEIKQIRIQSLAIRHEKIALHSHNNNHHDKPLLAKQVVIAAGAWSHQLTQSLGDKLPLETERGYNTTLPEGAFPLHTHLSFGGHGFVISRINGGIRVGGAVELGGLKLAPNFKRAKALLDKAARFLPELNTANGKQWMGFRPSLPDSLPIIDYASHTKRIVYAFGHGHLGLTQSAATGKLVAELVAGKTSSIPMGAFSAKRF